MHPFDLKTTQLRSKENPENTPENINWPLNFFFRVSLK